MAQVVVMTGEMFNLAVNNAVMYYVYTEGSKSNNIYFNPLDWCVL